MGGDLAPVRDFVKANSVTRKKWEICQGGYFMPAYLKLHCA